MYTPQEMEQIRQLVIKHNLYLFSDEVYREFINDAIRLGLSSGKWKRM